jgi:exodeoxyribonuclease-3
MIPLTKNQHLMKIATWNINSIRPRLERLLAFLDRHRPDVVCLQELKVVDADFPAEPLLAAGYHAAVFDQKTYNGVAILSRTEPADVRRGLDCGEPDARLISADVGGIRIASVYVPNGQIVASVKYAYKLKWMQMLRERLQQEATRSTPLVLCGDMNVARDELDVARPQQWAPSVLFHVDARQALEHLIDFGLVDVLRQQHPEGGIYSWWDYRMLAFPRNNGLRLDYILATEPVAARCTSAIVDRDERKGEKPSDHAPVLAEFAL